MNSILCDIIVTQSEHSLVIWLGETILVFRKILSLIHVEAP